MHMCLCCVAVSRYVRGNGDGWQPAAADIIYSASPPVTKGLSLVCHTDFNLGDLDCDWASRPGRGFQLAGSPHCAAGGVLQVEICGLVCWVA